MSLADLTTLTNDLIAQTGRLEDDEDTTTTTQPQNDESFWPGPPKAPDEDDTPDADEFKGFSKTDKFEFERVVSWIIANAFGGSADGQTTLIDNWVNEWAERWRHNAGLRPWDFPNRTPTIEDLLRDDEFVNGALWLPFTATTQVPPIFTSEKTNAEGETVPAVAVSDPLRGIIFYDFDELSESPDRTRVSFALAAADPTDPLLRQTLTDRERRILVDTLAMETGGAIGTFGGRLTQAAPTGTLDRQPLPHLSLADLAALAKQPATTSSASARRVSFDRDALIERAASQWRNWLIEGPNDERVANMVDAYIREAKAFWHQGGQLDFDTFVKNKLRSQPRYQLIFRHLPEGMDEDEFIGQFRQPIQQLGLRPETTLEQTQAAVTSGGSAVEQLKRITRTREAQNVGGFSQRLAQTVRGLGAASRA